MPKFSALNRSFSRRESILLLILAVVLIVGVYYLVVVKGTSDTIQQNESEYAEVQTEVATGKTLLAQRKAMKAELDSLGSNASLPVVGTYDNLAAEVDALNGLLGNAEAYNISFDAPKLSGTTVRRDATITFTMSDTAQVTDVIKALDKGSWACDVKDVAVSAAFNSDGSMKNVSGSIMLTYYETTTGAKTTAGLVEDTESEPASKHISAAEVSAAFLSGGAVSGK